MTFLHIFVRPLRFLCFIIFVILLIAKGLSVVNAVDPDNPRCSEPRDKGEPCPREGTPSSKKFYYNSQMGVCQPFIFNGCEGNSNRFDSSDECRQACASSSKRDTWVLADRCNASHLIPDGHYIECTGQSCPQGHNCQQGICCPTKEYVCTLQDDTGTFAEGVPDKPRFAWNADIKSCWRFSYYGAKGNYNNFPSFQDCLTFCGGVSGGGNNNQQEQQQPSQRQQSGTN